MKYTVELDKDLVNDVCNQLGDMEKKAPNALANALNYAARNIRTNVSKEIRQDYNIKAGDIKDSVDMNRASRNSLGVAIKATKNRVGLDKFKVSPKTIQPRRKKPIKVAVKKTGLKPLFRAFIADLSGIKVARRKGKKRVPIKRLYGPSISQMLRQDIKQRIDTEGQKKFYERLDHEVKRILDKGANG